MSTLYIEMPRVLRAFANRSMRRLGPLLFLAFTACGGGGDGIASTPPDNNPPPGPAVASGWVMGGQQPVIGAVVKLYAAGASAGVAPTLLAKATTDSAGAFNIASLTCPAPTSQVYYVASGGNAGAGANSALHLLAALGECRNIPDSADVNELTTAAAAYALAQFLGADGSGTTLAHADQLSGSALGLQVAVNRALSLADVVHGSLGAAVPAVADCSGSDPKLNCVAAEKLDTLADALAACVNSAGAATNGCATLFCAASPGASYDSSSHACSIPAVPTDTLQAAVSIALHPGTISSAGVHALAGTMPVFAPSLAGAPSDWALALNFSGGGLNEPEAVAVDANNQLWVANYNNVVSEFNAQGIPLSTNGYAGGGLEESFGIAIAPDGNIWVSNEQSNGGANAGRGTLTVLAPDGSILSGSAGYNGGGLSFPVALAIDAAGNAWTANDANASVSSFSGSGTVRSPAAGYSGSGLGFPSGVAVDGVANVWISNTSSNAVTKLSNSGGALSGNSGYTGGGLNGPSAIALDAQNNAWVSNFYGDSVSALDAGGQPLVGTPYRSGAFASPAGIAVDGAGNVWVTNYHGASVSALAGVNAVTPGAALSPAAGFTGGGLSLPFNPAIDQAGNVWIGNSGNDSITEFIGIAAPVRTPISGLPTRP